ncbi:MAG: hypothetical protein JRJ77_03915 [Deltaproteobacteria bacterium]|nr:hypothetical protein [Deltaproteobacteria bacterium]
MTKDKTKTNWYRPPESYRSRDPVKRQRQLANLKSSRGRKPGAKQGFTMKALQKANIIDFATDFLGLSFKKRPAQEVLLRAFYGLPLTGEQKAILGQLTHNEGVSSATESTEATWALGARGGKSFLASIIGLYEGTRSKWAKYLNPGEKGYVVIVATRIDQARQVIGASCLRMLENSALKHLINDSTMTELSLRTGISIISLPCNSTAGRGLPICCLILDEVAHYRVEGPKADELVFSSLRPRLAQFPGAKVVMISTPAAKQGLLWDYFEEGFQVAGRVTAQGHTRLLNPLIPQDFIDSEYRRNPDNAEREFGAMFSEQVSAFFPLDALQACFTLLGDLDYQNHTYCAGIDQSGLAGRDRFAFSIAHKEDEQIKVDVVRSWETKDSEVILADIKALTEEYLIRRVTIDRYAGGWVSQALEKLGLEVQTRPSLPEVYVNLKSLVIAGRLELPDHQGLRSGLIATQAYYGRSNTLSIAHERTREGHGDEADATATAVWSASREIEGANAEIYSVPSIGAYGPRLGFGRDHGNWNFDY